MKNTALITFVLCCIISCNTLRGHRGVSDSIKESKRRGVFICEYSPSGLTYQYDNKYDIIVNKAWLEKQWAYDANTNETIIIDSSYQLKIETNDKVQDSYGFEWRIGINGDHYIRTCGHNLLDVRF